MYPVFYHVRSGSELAKFPVPEGESLLECLEEAIYILWELTPVGLRHEVARDWNANGGFEVSYHRCEFARVQRVSEFEFEVVDHE